jgi:hypothetical protein
MDQESVKLFGPITNFVLSFAVVVYGYLAWCRSRSLGSGVRFDFMAYRCWWASWLCWVFAWGILLVTAMSGLDPLPIELRIVTLIFDNLNSVFMILVYFVITRGNDFDKRRLQTAFMQISGSLFLGCMILYLMSRATGLDFAYEVHRTWSLCLSVFAPMLIGWGCYLRYNTRLILIVGFAYGFMQPFIYTTELVGVKNIMSPEGLVVFKPVFAMTLGGLKVLWAILFTQVLAHGASDGESIINQKFVHYHFFRRWQKKVLGHALVIGVAYCCLLIDFILICLKINHAGINDLATALTIVCGFMALLDWFWKLWDKGTQKKAASPNKEKDLLPLNIKGPTTVDVDVKSELVCNSKLGDVIDKTTHADSSH